MVRSKATSAHVYTSVEVDFEHVDRTRRAHGDAFRDQEGFGLTYLPFIVRAVADAMHEYPIVNASIDGDSMVVHHALHLGIAVDLDFAGLLGSGRQPCSVRPVRASTLSPNSSPSVGCGWMSVARSSTVASQFTAR